MNEYCINPNNLPVVTIVHSKEAILAGTESGLMPHFISSSVQAGDNPFFASAYLLPSNLQEYDFVWLEDEGVEAMWLDNELIIDSSPLRPFKSSRLFKAVSFVVKHKRALFWLLGVLFFLWMLNEFGLKGAIINTIVWTSLWLAYKTLKRAVIKY